MDIKDIAAIYSVTKSSFWSRRDLRISVQVTLFPRLRRVNIRRLQTLFMRLGFQTLGKKTAKDLARTFHTYEGIKNATYDRLIAINDIGDVVANDLIDFCKRNYMRVVQELFDAGIVPQEDEESGREACLKANVCPYRNAYAVYAQAGAGID